MSNSNIYTEQIELSSYELAELYKMVREIHKALFYNPTKTKDQSTKEIIEQMKARKLMQGVQKRNKKG